MKGFAKGDPRAREVGRLGGQAAQVVHQRKRFELWLRRFPGLHPEIAKVIYKRGYQAGWSAARHEGKA